MKRSASPSPSLRRSKRSKRPPARTPQTVAERLAQSVQQSPEELIALENKRLIAKLAVLQRKAERESRTRTPKRDPEFYLSDPFFYETRDPRGTTAPVEVAHDDMLIFLVENTLFRLPCPALVAHSELFANMFTFPPPPDEAGEGRSDERPIILHSMRAEGMRQYVYWWIEGKRGHVYPFSCLVPLLQFAHQAGAHDVYRWAARALEGYHITRRPAWRHKDNRHANPGPPDPERALCANHLFHEENDVYPSELDQIPGYPPPDHAFTVRHSWETLLYDDVQDLHSFKWAYRMSRAEAINVLENALDAGIDVAFLPGALGSVVVSGTLSVDEKARLMKGEKGATEAVVEAVRYKPDGINGDKGRDMLGTGGQLVENLNRALYFWAYCKRIEGETTYGMLSAVIRVIWPAPDESSVGWEVMCVQP